jgi:hypothetical protein
VLCGISPMIWGRLLVLSDTSVAVKAGVKKVPPDSISQCFSQ